MTPTTTPTINGLRLVSPEEAGYQNVNEHGYRITAILLKNGKPYWSFNETSTFGEGAKLIPLPKPRTTRPHRRGEVKCGDVFRRKADGSDYMVFKVSETGVCVLSNYFSYQDLLTFFHRLTYDSEGREVLSEAGQTEEQS